MAGSMHLRHIAPVLFIFVVISQSSIAAGRPISYVGAATKPEINLALPGALPNKIGSDSDGVIVQKQNIPCESANEEVPLPDRFRDGSYRSLFLSALPKGTTVPPSGPSRRTNGMNN